MSGLKLTIPTTFNISTLPYLRDDAVLPKQGALMLLDPTHPANPWAAGVPADGLLLPNIAESQSLAMVGFAADNQKMKMLKPAAFSGASGLLERSSKGGLHGIVPQSGAHVLQSGAVMHFTAKQLAYILANKTHDYYMSAWLRITRRPVPNYASGTAFGINGNGQQTNSSLFHYQPSYSSTNDGSYRPAHVDAMLPGSPTFYPSASTPLDNKFIALGAKNWYTSTAGLESTVPGDGLNQSITGAFAGGGIPFGSPTLNWPGIGATGVEGTGAFSHQSGSGVVSAGGPLVKDSIHSQIVYRLYLEDLTVSGRSYAQVKDLDFAEYTKQVLTVGGRYNGDTFTNPSTMP